MVTCPEARAPSWLLLLLRMPREPTAPRVAVWRKLKRLGAVLLQDAVWVLPATDWTAEQFRWLSTEILECGGEAMLWEARLAFGSDDELVQRFQAQVNAAYGEVLGELARDGTDLAALSRRYQVVTSQDYFQSELGKRVREALASARGVVER